MSTEQIFSLANGLALLGWLVLATGGAKKWAAGLVCGTLLPLLLAVAYLGLLLGHLGEAQGGGFGSLAAVSALFASHWMLLAGWIHYLCFDLFIGAWQVRDAQTHGIPRLLVIPCLLFTFLVGPVGLLLYFCFALCPDAATGN